MSDQYDIDDIEAFIKGLKDTFDTLDESNPNASHGLQVQLAKAISVLRYKKFNKFKELPKFSESVSKEELKIFLINELEFLKNILDSDEANEKRFDMVMKIAKLREQINDL